MAPAQPNSYQMPLAQLLESIAVRAENHPAADLSISDISIDSRQVTKGTLFCAYPGGSSDGREYIQQAESAGAVAIICEASSEYVVSATVPVFFVEKLQSKVGLLAHCLFGEPSNELQVFGITGTNGKTTCCYLLTQAFVKMGMSATMIGTIGTGSLSDMTYASQTTPSPIEIHRLLAEWRDQGVTQVCMEVSSHALDQGRVAGVQFFATLFTNLSHDHLDYHNTMTDYANAKRKLFTDYASELVITNADDDLGAGLVDLANSEFIASYGLQGDVSYEDLLLSESGIELRIETSGVDFLVVTPLVGKVNVPNILLVAATLLSLSTPVDTIQAIFSELNPAPGRMELYSVVGRPKVVVDYAHTPDALEKALLSVREHCSGQLWCVFGCGGDRDADKRAVMGRAVDQFADQIVVTNDNPRSEQPTLIAEQILNGIQRDAQVILDRAAAIECAISNANADDWILVAGKGHETTQQIHDTYHSFSDREYVSKVLGVAA